MNYFYVYVLKSIKTGRQYTGLTKDLDKRLANHNAGRTKSTKPYKPWKIIYFEKFEYKIDALNREKFLKTGQGRDFLKNKLKAS